MSSETSRSTAATGKAYRALKELVRAALATLSAALATALNPNRNPDPAPDPTTLTPTQVEQQCNDPALVHCGLEKCVAADGSVEWVAAHSKARRSPSAAYCPQPHAPVPNARVAALSPPTRRNASSARAPRASFGTSTAWKSLRTRTHRGIKLAGLRLDSHGSLGGRGCSVQITKIF